MLFLIDEDMLMNFFNHNEKAIRLFDKFNKCIKNKLPMDIITTNSILIYSITHCPPETEFGYIQQALSVMQVVPSYADYTNKGAIRQELLRIGAMIAGGRRHGIV